MAKKTERPITIEWLLERAADHSNGCWLWLGATSGNTGRGRGYAKAKIDGITVYVHREVHETFIGPIPEGYQVDHLCKHWYDDTDPIMHRRCVNPDHLEAVTQSINILRNKQRSKRR